MNPDEQNQRRIASEARQPQPLSLDPTNPFELLLAEQIRHLRADVDRLNTRLNWLFTLILGAAVTNIVLAVLQ